MIRQRISAAQSRQKKYANKKVRRCEYSEGELVFLKVTSCKGLQQSKKLGKLAPRFVGSFQILERVGLVAYRFALLLQFSSTHDVFHISAVKDYIYHLEHILNYHDITLREDMLVEDRLVKIVKRREQVF